jgi:2-dehydro-3-deoxyphosphooctonate aldolase (KDO 8-P synthase)
MRKFKINKKIDVGGKFLLLAGPCVVEGKLVCLEIAEFLSSLAKKLGISYVFKASYDKANRSSGTSFRGPGISKGLEILAEVKEKFELPILTDIHESGQAEEVAKIADIIQIPAFLCRQTSLLLEAGVTGKTVNIKKGQFMSPVDMKNAVEKVFSTGNKKVMLTERGTFFGYNNLVVDMRSLPMMRDIGVPVIFDATHSVQTPGGLGNASGGRREFVAPLARAATAVGIDGLFIEVHPKPEKALSDGPNSLSFKDTEKILKQVIAIHEIQRKNR